MGEPKSFNVSTPKHLSNLLEISVVYAACMSLGVATKPDGWADALHASINEGRPGVGAEAESRDRARAAAASLCAAVRVLLRHVEELDAGKRMLMLEHIESCADVLNDALP
jgi:hypothetical protein